MLFRGCVDAAVISCLFLLAACGGDSSGSKGTEPADDSASSSTVGDIMADSFNDLPVCTVKHKGAVAYVKDEKKLTSASTAIGFPMTMKFLLVE